MEKRLTKEITVKDTEIFKSKIGTLNKLRPDVLYIHSKAMAKPSSPDGDYIETVSKIRDSFCRYIDNTLKHNKLFENKNIVNFDVSDRGLSVGRGSHVKYELYVKPVEVKPMGEFTFEMENLAKGANNKLLELFEQYGINCY